MQMAIAFLCTRVLKPCENDWKKLIRLVQYLRKMVDETLTTVGEDIGFMYSFVNASYAVHNDRQSHTGGAISWGTGELLTKFSKQKLNTESSTEAEVVGVSDFLPNVIWTQMFLEARGCPVHKNIIRKIRVL